MHHNVSLDGALTFADEVYKIRGIYGYPPEPSEGWCPVNKGNQMARSSNAILCLNEYYLSKLYGSLQVCLEHNFNLDVDLCLQ